MTTRGRNSRAGRRILTEECLTRGLRHLTRRDPDLARLADTHGPPPMWAREPGFPTLIQIILEQQVSLASAKAAFGRLAAAAAPLNPRSFLGLDDALLKEAGFSRQKITYGRHLARSVLDGRLDLSGLVGMDDDAVRSQLLKIKGIGPWTADIYLLMALGRPDVWPSGDLALAVAAQEVKRLSSRPTAHELEALSESWRPWRAVAARLLWHYYLSGKRRQPARRSALDANDCGRDLKL